MASLKGPPSSAGPRRNEKGARVRGLWVLLLQLVAVGMVSYGYLQTSWGTNFSVAPQFESIPGNDVSFGPTDHAALVKENKTVNPSTVASQPNETESLLRSLLHDVPHPAMKCDNNNDKQQTECCVSWEVNVDEWWTHHPDWRIVSETSQHYCFAKFPEPHGTFFRNLYKTQFIHDGDVNVTGDGMDVYHRTSLPPMVRNCSSVYRYQQVISGVGAILGGQLRGLYSARQLQRPFQMSHKKEWNHWKYVGSSDAQHWSWCPTKGLDCFVLPLSNCPHIYTEQSDNIGNSPSQWSPAYALYMQYLLRYQHKVRWRLRRFMDEHDAHVHGDDDHNQAQFTNCTAFHIRRGDAGLHYQPFRRYPSLLEYIRAGNVSQDEPIVLLTDDVTTIREAEQFYSDYTWIYMNRTRVNMTFSGFGSHINVGDNADPGDEIIAMRSEARAAARCRKLVHARSGFVLVILSEYYLDEREPPEMFMVDTSVPKEEVTTFQGAQQHDRAQLMIDQIYREAAKELQKRMDKAKANIA